MISRLLGKKKIKPTRAEKIKQKKKVKEDRKKRSIFDISLTEMIIWDMLDGE